MKKIIYSAIVATSVFLLLFVASCAKDPTTDSSSEANNPNAFLTVEEAQGFFEESFASLTRSASTDCLTRGLFPTGEYTPLWSDARTSENQGLGSVDIPIMTEYQYRAIRSEFKNGRAHAYMVGIEQKLIVVKSKDSNETAQYILTLIPDKDYYSKHKNNFSNKFINSGDKGSYSGYALYTYHGTPIRLNRYRSGKRMRTISTHNVSGSNEQKEREDLIIEEINSMNFQYMKKMLALTRIEDNNDYANNWHLIWNGHGTEECYCYDESGNITCGRPTVDPDYGVPCIKCGIIGNCDCVACLKCGVFGDCDCKLDMCPIRLGEYCDESCYTCGHCETPHCDGLCQGSSDMELCQYKRCPIDNCQCCDFCKGECMQKCEYGDKCHVYNDCVCCEICKQPCLNNH